jgi:hypothetical protein
MKKLILLAVCCFVLVGTHAQKYFFPEKAGTVLKYKNYDADGNIATNMSWMTYTITDIREENGNKVAYVAIDWEGKEDQMKEMPEGLDKLLEDFKIHFEKDRISNDFLKITAQYLTQALKGMGTNEMDMDIESTGDGIVYIPNTLEEGDELPESDPFKLTLKVSLQGMSISGDINIKITDRKVENKENVTTPAGTFDCIRLNEENEFSINMVMVNQSERIKSVSYLTPGIGIVKSETYHQDKLQNYLLLEEISMQ